MMESIGYTEALMAHKRSFNSATEVQCYTNELQGYLTDARLQKLRTAMVRDLETYLMWARWRKRRRALRREPEDDPRTALRK